MVDQPKPIQTIKDSSKLLLELHRLKKNSKAEDANALFKKYSNPKDPNVHSQIIRAFTDIKTKVQNNRSTVGYENHINGAIIGLNFIKATTSAPADLSKINQQIEYLKQFRQGFNSQVILEDVIKEHPELAATCKEPQTFKDFVIIATMYGKKQKIPVSTAFLLLNLYNGNPKLFRELLKVLQTAYLENQRLISSDVIPNLNSDYNVKVREIIKDTLKNLYILDLYGINRTQQQELITFLFAMQERVVPSDIQIRKDMMLYPINPNPTPQDDMYRVKSRFDEFNRKIDKKLEELNNELSNAPDEDKKNQIDASIKLQESLKNYAPSKTTGIYQTIQWNRPDPKIEIWEHTIGSQSPEGHKKESSVVLDLSYLGEMTPDMRRQVFTLINACDLGTGGESADWITEYLQSSQIPPEIQAKLDAMETLTDQQKASLIKTAIEFNTLSHLAFFKNLSTFAD